MAKESSPIGEAQSSSKQNQPPRVSFDCVDFKICDEKLTFFSHGSRKNRDTWIVSLFVILHIVLFVATMAVNNCAENSHGDCALKAFGRLSCQPVRENPLLGPSASTLDTLGALRRRFLVENKIWRLITSACLHAGVIHLVINLTSLLVVGIYLEQEFGAFRIGAIYILSAFLGSLVAALFVQDGPQVCSSGGLFGLLGAILSGLIRNWKAYTKKVAALAFIFTLFTINFIIGLLPLVDNFSSIGGFVAGVLLGFVLLYTPEQTELPQNKAGLFDFEVNCSSDLKKKLDKPVLRIITLLIYLLLLIGCIIGILQRIDLNQYCAWCRSIDCIPTKRWSCHFLETDCEAILSDSQLTLTCNNNGNFKVYPFTEITQARIGDLCSLICS